MSVQCPNCSNSAELVQSTPTVILLCKGCGSFFDSSMKPAGDLKTGLDAGVIPSKSNTDIVESTPIVESEPPQAEQPQKRTESMLSILSGNRSDIISNYGCPKCDGSMKELTSPITGNILYTCNKCGHTGTNYVKK